MGHPHSRSCLKLDLTDERLWDGDRVIDLTPKLFSMLRFFVLNPNCLLVKREILAEVWPATHVTEGSVKDCVKNLRRVLGDDSRRPRFIETVRGRGYRFLGGIALIQHNPTAEFRGTSPAFDSIAILPFDCANQGAAAKRVAHGLATQIVTRLSKARYYRMIAPETLGPGVSPQRVERFGGTQGARWLMDGRLEILDKRLRTNVRVLAAATGEICWAQTYDLMLGDLQSDIDHLSRVVTGNLCGLFRSLIGFAMPDGAASDWNARDHVIHGYSFFFQHTKAGINRAIDQFQKAVTLFPYDYFPHTALADACYTAVRYGWTESPERYLRRAHEHAWRSCQLNDTAYEALWALGVTRLLQHDYDAAADAYEAALALSPDVPNLIANFGELLLYFGKPEDAIAQVKEAQTLNPWDSFPFYYAGILARAQTDLGDFEGALATYRAMGPAADRFVFDRATLLIRLDRQDEAIRMLQSSRGGGAVGSLTSHVQGLRWGRPYQNSEGAFSSLERQLECLTQAGLSPGILRALTS